MNKIDLKKIRKSSGLNQKELANLLGIKQQQYSRYETNTNKIPLEVFLKIVDVCQYKIVLKKENKKYLKL